jgi:hypothetical protein
VRAADDAERRGEAVFFRPFPHNPEFSCAACHIPSSAFVDHRQHNVGTGGLFKTPTLMNANFNAPYFHDGRFDTYDQVIDHFDRTFALGLSSQDHADLVVYLQTVGTGIQPYERPGVDVAIKEINAFARVFRTAIPAHDNDAIALAVHTIGAQLRDLVEQFPSIKDTTVTDGLNERLAARTELKNLVLLVRRIGDLAGDGQYDEADAELQSFRKAMTQRVPFTLERAQPFSLFIPEVHDAHFSALRQLVQSAQK